MNNEEVWGKGYKLLNKVRVIKPELVSKMNVADISPTFINRTIDILNNEISNIESLKETTNKRTCQLLDIKLLIEYIADYIKSSVGKESTQYKQIRELYYKCRKTLEIIDPL